MDEAERLVYERRLLEAREKRHLLITGGAVEQFVDQNGEQVKYTKASLRDLDAYILQLEGILNPALVAYRRPRPIGFLF